MSDILLETSELCVDYLSLDGDPLRACTDINLTVRRGELLGIAGESASGKSTLLTALTRLQRPPAVTTGRIVYHPPSGPAVDLTTLSDRAMSPLRWTEISVVMQSAMACLNPVTTISAQFRDVLRLHNRRLSWGGARRRTGELLEMVGIPADRMSSYPHQLSGGMRQRVLIALSLACDPQLVVMDEPTTAVDVVTQRQILTQILTLRERLGFTALFVTHDLALLMEIADRIAIMYAGRIVETGPAAQIYESPQHPYTRGLRDAYPPLTEPVRELTGIPGAPPDLRALPPGCAFAPRCPLAFDRCIKERPELRPAGGGTAACHLAGTER